jgi:AbrB family looped-hinge helix DNA binding protein
MATVSVSTKGQVVLPLEIRRKLGIEPGTRLEVELVGDTVLLRPVNTAKPSSVEEGFGMLKYVGPPVTIDAFDERIAAAFREGKL